MGEPIEPDSENIEIPDEVTAKRKRIVDKIERMVKIIEDVKEIKPKIVPYSAFRLIDIDCNLEDTLPHVFKSNDSFFVCQLPILSYNAQLEVKPLPQDANIIVGWVHVVTDISYIQSHGNHGFLSYELPNKRTTKQPQFAISNSFIPPWLEADEGLVLLEGPTEQPTILNIPLVMAEVIQAKWRIESRERYDDVSLSYVYKKVSYASYLMYRNVAHQKQEILKVVTFTLEVALDIDPQKPLSERVIFLGPCEQMTPKVHLNISSVPLYEDLFNSPTFHDNLGTVWRSIYRKCEFTKKPKKMNISETGYLENTRNITKEGHLITKRTFLESQKEKIAS